MTESLELTLHNVLKDLLVLHSAADQFVLTRHGLRRARYYVLHHLYQTPERTLGQLSALTLMYSASLSRMIYSMEQEGLVARQANEQDRRLFTLSLTENGRRLYETVSAELAADIRQRFGELDAAQLQTLVALNGRLVATLDAHRQRQEQAES